jgi:hypothetical protein
MKKLLFIVFLVELLPLQAQETNFKDEIVNRRSLGFSVQQAIPFYKLPEGKSYKATGITANFHQPFFKSKRKVNLGIDFIPQFWISYAHVVSYEVGLNAAININFEIKKSSLLSFSAGSGFHYFGMHTTQQAHGFLFADNFLGSYKHSIKLKNGRLYDIGVIAGYRHMSNLHINPPNGAIENLILGICFDRIF